MTVDADLGEVATEGTTGELGRLSVGTPATGTELLTHSLPELRAAGGLHPDAQPAPCDRQWRPLPSGGRPRRTPCRPARRGRSPDGPGSAAGTATLRPRRAPPL